MSTNYVIPSKTRKICPQCKENKLIYAFKKKPNGTHAKKCRDCAPIKLKKEKKLSAANAIASIKRGFRTPKWLSEEQIEQIGDFYVEAQRLSKATGIKHSVDHIIPLLGKRISGLHVPWNLQILTLKANQNKHAKDDLSPMILEIKDENGTTIFATTDQYLYEKATS